MMIMITPGWRIFIYRHVNNIQHGYLPNERCGYERDRRRREGRLNGMNDDDIFIIELSSILTNSLSSRWCENRFRKLRTLFCEMTSLFLLVFWFFFSFVNISMPIMDVS